jgi:hypothetical protein
MGGDQRDNRWRCFQLVYRWKIRNHGAVALIVLILTMWEEGGGISASKREEGAIKSVPRYEDIVCAAYQHFHKMEG